MINTSRNSTSEGRLVWVDLLRLLATFMVIAIHCADPFNVSPEARSNPEYNFWGAFYGSMLRPCVPLFVMITGLLLLPVKEGLTIFYKKRLMRIAIPFLVWSVMYNLFPWLTGILGLPASTINEVFAYAPLDASQSLGDALKNMALIPFNFNVYTVPMWYLYMLIGLYLYMPFFSAWIEKADKKQQQVFLAIWGITSFLPYLRYYFMDDVFGLCAWNGFDTFYYFAGFNGYLLLGHYLSRQSFDWSWAKTIAISVPLFVIGYVVTYIGFRSITANPDCSEKDLEMFFLYCSPNVLLMTLSVFLLVRRVRIRGERLVALLANLTKCGLGIYLLHYFMVGLGYSIADVLAIPVSIKIPITAVIVLLMTWSVVALIYKMIPKVAKWILG